MCQRQILTTNYCHRTSASINLKNSVNKLGCFHKSSMFCGRIKSLLICVQSYKKCNSSPSTPHSLHSRSSRGTRLQRPVSIGSLCEPSRNLMTLFDNGWGKSMNGDFTSAGPFSARVLIRCFTSSMYSVYMCFVDVYRCN